MSCLNPPLTRKPSKGFAWQCAFCTRQEADSNPQSPVASSSTTGVVESPAASRPTSKSPSIVKDTSEDTASPSSSNRTRTRTTRSQLMRQSSSTAMQKQTTPEASKNIRLKLTNNNIGSSGSIDRKIVGLKRNCSTACLYHVNLFIYSIL
jgi:hypothetical protein